MAGVFCLCLVITYIYAQIPPQNGEKFICVSKHSPWYREIRTASSQCWLMADGQWRRQIRSARLRQWLRKGSAGCGFNYTVSTAFLCYMFDEQIWVSHLWSSALLLYYDNSPSLFDENLPYVQALLSIRIIMYFEIVLLAPSHANQTKQTPHMCHNYCVEVLWHTLNCWEMSLMPLPL